MRTDKSFSITKRQYDYLLPIYGIAAAGTTRLLQRGGRFFFIGSREDYLEMLTRCEYL